jgi:hypothetical protein
MLGKSLDSVASLGKAQNGKDGSEKRGPLITIYGSRSGETFEGKKRGAGRSRSLATDVEEEEGGTGAGDEDWMTTAHVTTREFGLGFSFLSSQTTRPSSFSTQLTQEQYAFCRHPVDMPN